MTGFLFVVEGNDGCGKATQVKRIVDHASRKDFKVKHYDFPQYDTPLGGFVKEYLGKKYGHPMSHHPYTSTLPNAMDQFQAIESIEKDLSEDKVLISDRYWFSNQGYGGARCKTPEQRESFYRWCANVFEPMPVPNHTIFLKVPAEISMELIKKRAEESGRTIDVNEEKIEYQRNVQDSYLQYFRRKPSSVTIIDCAPNGKTLADMRSRDDISSQIALTFDMKIGEHEWKDPQVKLSTYHG